MPIETIDDIIDELMDRMGIFGAHPDGVGDGCMCRCCQASSLRDRLFAAFEVHRRLEGGESIIDRVIRRQ